MKIKLAYDNGMGKGKAYLFYCPGCKRIHTFRERDDHGNPEWEWNGDAEKPTIRPSIKVTRRYPNRVEICHSFISNGMIKFLADSTHQLAGHTSELPELD